MRPVKSNRRTRKQRTHGLRSTYPNNWDEIAQAVKDAADNRCVRCGHPNDKPFNRWTDHGHEPSPCDLFCTHPRDRKQRILTVHHLDLDKGNCELWDLIALCIVCHWRIHAIVDVHQLYMLEHAEWIQPYIERFLEHNPNHSRD